MHRNSQTFISLCISVKLMQTGKNGCYLPKFFIGNGDCERPSNVQHTPHIPRPGAHFVSKLEHPAEILHVFAVVERDAVRNLDSRVQLQMKVNLPTTMTSYHAEVRQQKILSDAAPTRQPVAERYDSPLLC